MTKPRHAAAVALALLLAPAASRCATAGVPAKAVAGINEAFGKLDEKAGRSRVIGTLPRWFVPEDRALLEQMWSVPGVLGAAPYGAQDMPALINIRDRENVLLNSYLLFAPKPSEEPDRKKNAIQFQDEIVRGEAFAAHLSAVMLTALGDFAAQIKPEQMTDQRREGLKQLRLDIVEQAQAAALVLRTPGLSLDNRKLLVDALADSADEIAAGSTRFDRDGFSAIATSVEATLSPAEKERMESFADAMDRQDCKGLCDLN